MTIPAITLTGLDVRTDLSKIETMFITSIFIAGARSVEFAVLLSPKGGHAPRYPTIEEVARITEALPVGAVSYHLCGGYARMVHEGQWDDLASVIDFSRARRVQVNSARDDDTAILTLQRFSAFIGRPVIMQWRGETFPLVPGLHLLQDRSGGRGISETLWSSPDALCKAPHTEIGYAGGLNPANIGGALPQIAKAAGRHHFWIDCESGIRTDDWFDVEKAKAMIDSVMFRWRARPEQIMPFIVGSN